MTEETVEETVAEETKELTFEGTLKKLEDVVERLESVSSLTLDQALEAFEEGVRLTRSCRKILDGAQLRVEQLIEEDRSQMHAEPLDVEDEVSPATDDDIPF